MAAPVGVPSPTGVVAFDRRDHRGVVARRHGDVDEAGQRRVHAFAAILREQLQPPGHVGPALLDDVAQRRNHEPHLVASPVAAVSSIRFRPIVTERSRTQQDLGRLELDVEILQAAGGRAVGPPAVEAEAADPGRPAAAAPLPRCPWSPRRRPGCCCRPCHRRRLGWGRSFRRCTPPDRPRRTVKSTAELRAQAGLLGS